MPKNLLKHDGESVLVRSGNCCPSKNGSKTFIFYIKRLKPTKRNLFKNFKSQ